MIYLSIILIYLVLKYIVPNSSAFYYIINPFFWIIFSIVILFTTSSKYINKSKDRKMVQISAVIALLYIAIYSVFGFLVTFGKNPYSITIIGILTNIWVTGVMILCREYIRYKIISNTRKKNYTLVLVLVTILFTLIEIDLATLIKSFGNASLMFKQIVSDVLPTIIKNILFTFIVSKYTYKSTVVYEMTINLFYWISPVLPNSPWILIAILDTIIPLIFYYIIKMQKDDRDIVLGREKNEKSDYKSTILFAVIFVLVACFATGLFPVEPKAVATASMYPSINVGDVVLIKKCGINDVKIGDVIEYQLEDQFIIHRITSKETKDGEVYIKTKGDNNNSEDANVVTKDQIIGKIIFKVKYIGIPSVWLNNMMSSDKEILVETGK